MAYLAEAADLARELADLGNALRLHLALRL
jgi:hypothetical protein